jgi:hypothetical protein
MTAIQTVDWTNKAGRKQTAIKLSSGHLAVIRNAGVRVVFQNHTCHRVLFFESEAHLAAGAIMQEHDFETRWDGPHPDPGSRMLRILERHCDAADRHKWKFHGYLPDFDGGGTPDTHGNLAHPSMAQFQPAEWP